MRFDYRCANSSSADLTHSRRWWNVSRLILTALLAATMGGMSRADDERHPLLDSDNKSVVISAIDAIERGLGLTDGRKVVPQLTELLEHKDVDIAARSATVLGKIGTKLKARTDETSTKIRMTAVKGLIVAEDNADKDRSKVQTAAKAAITTTSSADERDEIRKQITAEKKKKEEKK